MSFTFFDSNRDPLILFLLFLCVLTLFYAMTIPVFITGTPVAFSDTQKVDSVLLKKHVEFLSSLSPQRTHDQETLQKAGNYVRAELEKYCPTVKTQEFVANKKKYQNYICTFGSPVKKERIVVGAHYDSFSGSPGGDDNASGIAGILELARLLSVEKAVLTKALSDFNRRIDIVAYALEEPPFFDTASMGSYIHAQSLKKEDPLIKTRMVIVLEMIGYFSDDMGSQKYPNKIFSYVYPKKGNFVLIAGRINFKDWGKTKKLKNFMRSASPNLNTQSYNGFPGRYGIDFSDHASYWKHGYPALLVTDTAFYRNPHYHEATDRAETLDYKKMAEVVQGVYFGVLNL